MKSIKKIAVIVESSRAFGRGLIEGIYDFAKQQKDWQICFHEGTLETQLDLWLEHWEGDGIIMRVCSEKDARTLIDSGIPSVDLLGEISEGLLPTVDTDNAAYSRMAIDFYCRSGHRQLAFCGYPGLYYSDERQIAFNAMAEAESLNVINYSSPKRRSHIIAARESWHANREKDLLAWLKSLPKPIAIFACNDVRALELSVVCRLNGFKVPNEICIMGVDDDELICNMAHPPISSIKPNLHRQGSLGAELLSDLMAKKTLLKERVSIPPIGIQERPSTDIIHSEKEHVAAALRYIRSHFHQDIGTDDVAKACGVSRSLLDRDLKSELGYTVSFEIKRLRLLKIKHLVKFSTLTLNEIAQKSGFSNGVSLSTFFKSHTAMTPGKYKEISNRAPL